MFPSSLTPTPENQFLPTPPVGKLLLSPPLASPSRMTGRQVVSGVVVIVTSLTILVLTRALMVAAMAAWYVTRVRVLLPRLESFNSELTHDHLSPNRNGYWCPARYTCRVHPLRRRWQRLLRCLPRRRLQPSDENNSFCHFMSSRKLRRRSWSQLSRRFKRAF